MCYNFFMKRNVFNMIVVLFFVALYAFFEFFNTEESYELSDIPDYSGKDVIVLNNNEPNFDLSKITNESFEEYGDLDSLGRCTYGYANIGVDLMPTKNRERISSVKPTGWHYTKYDFIDDGILYNRCHLIAYSLTAENSNKENLITCTRHTNYDLMREYEEEITSYVKRTKDHVLYRVTPIFDGDNLVAKGVELEALSVGDNGDSIKYHIFIYNVQPGIVIDYKTGNSKIEN